VKESGDGGEQCRTTESLNRKILRRSFEWRRKDHRQGEAHERSSLVLKVKVGGPKGSAKGSEVGVRS